MSEYAWKKNLLNVLDIALLFYSHCLLSEEEINMKKWSPCPNYLEISKQPKLMRFYWQKIKLNLLSSTIGTQCMNTNDLRRVWETRHKKTKCFVIPILRGYLTVPGIHRSKSGSFSSVYQIRIAASLLITKDLQFYSKPPEVAWKKCKSWSFQLKSKSKI